MRYFSTQRPLTPGAFPKPSDNRVIAVENFDTYDGRMFLSCGQSAGVWIC